MVEKAPGGYYSLGMGTYKPKKMKEGRYKTNVKPPYWECENCGHRAPDYEFKHGAWWWKNNYCPECHDNTINMNPKRPKIAPAPIPQHSLRTDDKRHLEFIYSRLINVHGEDKNVDYMKRLIEIIDRK